MPTSTSASPRPSAPTVTAVLVTRGRSAFLDQTLAALGAQERLPDRVLLVDVEPGDATTAAVADSWPTGAGHAGLLTRVEAAAARTFGAAVRAALSVHPSTDDWVWLLHDDSAPRPTALAALLRAVEIAPSVAVAGCKQLDWDDPDRLVQVGVSTSRFGRRMTGLDDEEVDQGQHDGREDVLAVGLAGALVRRDVWDALGGPDPALGPYGDGLDLSRRARLAGHRVVVVPGAAVRHAAASLRPGLRAGWDARRSEQARREAFLHTQLTGVPGVLVPVVAVLAVVSGVVRAGMRLAVKEPHLVVAELLAPWAVLLRPGRLWAARRRAARTAAVRRAVLRPLQQDTRAVLRQVRDRRLAAAEARRTSEAPSELEARELAHLRTRRRVGLAGVLVAAFGLTVGVLGPWLSGVLAGGRLSGGTLAYGDAGLGDLWRAAGGWWVGTGLGAPTAPDPLLAVLLPGTALFGTVGRAAAAVVLGAWVLAAAGAWFAAGAVTRSVTLRVFAAVTWASAPALLTGLAEVRLGGLLTHLALPWAVLGVARALGVARVDAVASGLVGAQRVRPGHGEDGTVAEVEVDADAGAGAGPDSVAEPAPPPIRDHAEPSLAAAAGAGLALCVVTAGTPSLLPGVLVAVLGAWLLRPRRRLGWTVVPPLVLHGPLIASVVADPSSWRTLVVDPGLAQAAVAAPVWDQLLGWPVVPGLVWWLAWLPGAVLVLVAALALAAPSPAVRVVRLGWLVAAVGLASAAATGLVPVSVADGALTAAWTGGAVSLTTGGLLLAALVGAGGVRRALTRIPFGWRHLGAAGIAALAVATPLALLGAWVAGAPLQDGEDGGTGLEVSAASSVPAVARQLQTSPERLRVLTLVPVEPSADGGDRAAVAASLLTADGVQLVDVSRGVVARTVTGPLDAPVPSAPDEASQTLAGAVADLTVGTAGAAARLVDLGVGAVLLPPGGDGNARTELVGRLDATVGLERITETQAGVIWRVVAGQTPAGWARVVSGSTETFGQPVAGLAAHDGWVDTEVGAGAPDRLVVLAERADDGWRAWLDGVPLRSVEAGWRQAFELGPDDGHLVVRHEPAQRRPWLVVQLVVIGATVLLAVPVRRRRVR